MYLLPSIISDIFVKTVENASNVLSFYSKLGLFLVDDIQTPLSKVARLSFWPQKVRNVLKRMQKQFSDILHFFSSTNIAF